MLQRAAAITEAENKLGAAGFMVNATVFLLYCTFIDNDDCHIFHRQQIRSLHVSASSAVTVGVMNTHSKHTVTVSVIDSLEMLQKQPKHMQTSTAAVGNYTKLFL